MGTNITPTTFPSLCRALKLIEEDNGGHLIGTVYPGKPLVLDSFDVPDQYLSKIGPAERALKRIHDDDAFAFGNFIIGEETEQQVIAARYSKRAEDKRDVDAANVLLCAYFNGWEPDYDRTLGT